MRKILVSGLFILLSGCASTTNNYYTQTVQGWRGGNASTLVKRWGLPDVKAAGPNGTTVYVYKTTSYSRTDDRASPTVGVNFTNGRPVIITQANTNYGVTNTGISVTCVAAFEANREGIIINTQIQGNSCYGGNRFASDKSNPDQR